MTVRQVIGYVHSDGGFGADYQGRFTVEKSGEGTYEIKFPDTFDSPYPVVTLTPVSPYMTANAVLIHASDDRIVVHTGYTDKPSTEYMDCSFFFTAIG